MHTVDLLDQALAAAKALGIKVREDWLAGSGGGGCELRGQKWIFLDLDLDPAEKLGQVLDTLRGDPRLANLHLSHELSTLLNVRKSA